MYECPFCHNEYVDEEGGDVTLKKIGIPSGEMRVGCCWLCAEELYGRTIRYQGERWKVVNAASPI